MVVRPRISELMGRKTFQKDEKFSCMPRKSIQLKAFMILLKTILKEDSML